MCMRSSREMSERIKAVCRRKCRQELIEQLVKHLETIRPGQAKDEAKTWRLIYEGVIELLKDDSRQVCEGQPIPKPDSQNEC